MNKKPFHLFLFSLLILFLPSQLGKHFWPDFSLVHGIRIDYLSPTIYLTDLLVLGISASWLISVLKIKNQRSIRQLTDKTTVQNSKLYLLFLVVFVAINCVASSNPLLTIYKWGKFAEFVLLAMYVSQNSGLLLARRSLLAKAGVIGLFSIPLLYSSFLAFAQFFSQHSIGGLWWLLGERTFTSTTPGIAQIAVSGQLLLRPYATFSHPNQLAGYLLVISTLLLSQKTSSSPSPIRRRNFPLLGGVGWGEVIKKISLLFGISTLLITFSKAAMVAGFCALLLAMIVNRKKKKKSIISPLLIFLITIFVGLTSAWAIGILPYQDESIGQRLLLNSAALRMIFASPIIGVGLGNFIPRLSEFIQTATTASILQPVHNIYLLIAAETGIIGLGICMWFILRILHKQLTTHPSTPLRASNLQLTTYNLALLEILIIGLFDHYFVTLQQTQLLFAIVVGMAWKNEK